MKFLKDYEFESTYHAGKAIVMVDAVTPYLFNVMLKS